MSNKTKLLVYVAAAFSALRAYTVWYAYHEQLVPDTALYVHGGNWFYPSPIGRLIGEYGGFTGMEIATMVGGATLIYALAKISEVVGGSPALSTWVFSLCPVAFYLQPNSIDPLGASLCAWAIYFSLRQKHDYDRAYSKLLTVVACFTHVAVAPIMLVWSISRAGMAVILTAFFVAIPVGVGIALSPYGKILGGVTPSVYGGLSTFAIGYVCVAFYSWLFYRQRVTPAMFWMLAAAAFEAFMQGHVQIRYELLSVAVCIALVHKRDKKWTVRTETDGTRHLAVSA